MDLRGPTSKGRGGGGWEGKMGWGRKNGEEGRGKGLMAFERGGRPEISPPRSFLKVGAYANQVSSYFTFIAECRSCTRLFQAIFYPCLLFATAFYCIPLSTMKCMYRMSNFCLLYMHYKLFALIMRGQCRAFPAGFRAENKFGTILDSSGYCPPPHHRAPARLRP